MKGKILFVVGLGVGYVLGARAGRERYEQIRAAAQNVWNQPAVQEGVGTVREFAMSRVGDLGDTVLDNAKQFVRSVSGTQRPAKSDATDAAKAELTYKAKHFGIGSGLVVVAGFVGIFLLGTLIATGILALSLVMPGWAAALIVSGVLLLIIAILVGIAYVNFKRGSEPLETIESVRLDLDAVTGRGEYGNR